MNVEHKKVCVMGAGHIGLPTAGLLASQGYAVLAVDINPAVVTAINQGHAHINEWELDDLIQTTVTKKKLRAALKPEAADIFLLTVPTPITANKVADLSFVECALQSIAPFIRPTNLIILESTVPVGTTAQLFNSLLQLRPDLTADSVYFAYCPERVLPGQILRELIDNDRMLGGVNLVSSQAAEDFYKTFVRGQLWITSSKTAEMTKLAENAFRDVNIAFANELALICDHLQIQSEEVIRLANRHPRVNILQPGLGVGGHCIPVDPWFLVQHAPEYAHLLRTARAINLQKPLHIAHKIKQHIHQQQNAKLAFLGLTYKPDTNDIRSSPAIEIIKILATEYPAHTFFICDPHVKHLPESLQHLSQINFIDSESALEIADIAILLVKHQQYGDLNLKLAPHKILIDMST